MLPTLHNWSHVYYDTFTSIIIDDICLLVSHITPVIPSMQLHSKESIPSVQILHGVGLEYMLVLWVSGYHGSHTFPKHIKWAKSCKFRKKKMSSLLITLCSIVKLTTNSFSG